jgi:hypothetical protein
MDSEDRNSADVREGNPPVPAKSEEPKVPVESIPKSAEGEPKANDRSDGNKKLAKDKSSKKRAKGKAKKSKKTASPSASDSDSDSSDSDGSSSSSSADDSESEAEVTKKKRVTKKRQGPQKGKKTRAKKPKKTAKTQASPDSDSDSSDSGDSDSSEDEGAQKIQADDLLKKLQLLLLQQQQGGGSYPYDRGLNHHAPPPIYDTSLRQNPARLRRGGARPSGRANLNLGGIDPNLLVDGQQQQKDNKKRQKASKLDYKRVDQIWDDTIHNYKLQDTAEGTVDAQYDEFIFHVRRTFDWEGKYKATVVDIKSKLLRECLQDVMGGIKGVSLVDDTPKLDPNMLFL